MTRDINKKEFGLRLAQKRDLMGLSQTELGKELNPEKADNLGQQTISKFETGKQYPTYDELLSLSRRLKQRLTISHMGNLQKINETISQKSKKSMI